MRPIGWTNQPYGLILLASLKKFQVQHGRKNIMPTDGQTPIGMWSSGIVLAAKELRKSSGERNCNSQIGSDYG